MTSPQERREAVADRARWSEPQVVQRLLGASSLTPDIRQRAVDVATSLVEGARARRDERPFLDAFLQEFGLSNQEGIALMCIAEALLRIPDDATADRLIAEQLSTGDWSAHVGQSESLFVNASTWGLMLTGTILDVESVARADPPGWVKSLARKAGEPLVRLAVRRAMRIIGGEFVVGRHIDEALARSAREPELALCSFDMLGEGARTSAAAEFYLKSYERAIDAVGAAAHGRPPHEASGISIKLSALEARYSLPHRRRVMRRLGPAVIALARRAATRGIELTVDAEEADRLDLSLDILEALAADPDTHRWPGLGLAVQAYGKSALDVIDWAAAMARSTGRRLTLRLVKGAYWDTEIKRAQERGHDGYPVFTRKIATDASYLICAGRLLQSAESVRPQFATHNAHTIAAILQQAPEGAEFEFQRLHGMGRLLYAEAARQIPNFPPVRVYAPVGEHKDLLAYLVRRLLENGANTSFVNRFLDDEVPVSEVVRDPITRLLAPMASTPATVPLPGALYANRRNSSGIDLGHPQAVTELCVALHEHAAARAAAAFVANAKSRGDLQVITNPADRRQRVGQLRSAAGADIAEAFDACAAAQPAWNASGGAARAMHLEVAADLLERDRATFHDLLIHEAGKCIPDAIAEVREATDFCRYYAALAREQFARPLPLAGVTGESNELSLHGRGVFACISPWNFPLAIYAGQITAALAAGNTVVAKPAEPTPLVALEFTRLMHAAGIPATVLQCLPAAGHLFGRVAFAHPALAGVAVTGSNATALAINRALAAREGAIVPLIAETGGINAMLVDSTALPEQVVDDVISSAFISAGQRCSALRLLFLQDDVADTVIDMLAGAMDELVIGNPEALDTDVGPVITAAAAEALQSHVTRMQRSGRLLKACRLDDSHAQGSFVAPHLFELPSARELDSEVFGPLLHVVRYRARDLEQVLAAIRSTGYGLTLGVQTRLESTWRHVFAQTFVGNTYVNRNMIGAVVGVQPFGGMGLSGTGPKVGGPDSLRRYAVERTLTVNTTASGGNTALLNLGG